MSISSLIKKAISFLKNAKKVLTFGGIVNIQFNIVSSKNSLANKVALITGGTSGFGLAIAKQYLANGAQVIITGRSEKKISDALTILNSPNAKALFFMCQTEASVLQKSATLKKIINITSMEGVLGGFGPYYASKWAANGLTKGMAKTFVNNGIIVNAIAPGPAKTNINIDYFKGQTDNYYNPDPRTKTGRMVLVEEVAGLAAFLATDQANSIIGQVIVVDGGISLS